MNTTKPQSLNREDAQKLGGAISRWLELRDLAIKTPTSDAEVKGLTEYIASSMLEHASEFLGCWFVVRDEVEPAINLCVRFGQRINHVQRQIQAQFAAAQTEGAPSNIIPVK